MQNRVLENFKDLSLSTGSCKLVLASSRIIEESSMMKRTFLRDNNCL